MRKGKRLTALLLALVLCLSVLPAGVLASEAGAAEAVSPSVMAVTSGKCGKNVTWKLDGKGTLTISGKGAMYDYLGDEAPWLKYTYNDQIKSIVIKNGVTKIGAGAFGLCTATKLKITIANSVTHIGASAFEELGGLTSVTLPDNLTEIGNYAFHKCYDLTSIKIPDKVTNIPFYAFGECDNLSKVVISRNVTNIDDFAFQCCGKLTSVVIPDKVQKIGENSFAGCDNLRKIYFTGNAPAIKSQAFGKNPYRPVTITATAYYPKGNKTWTSSKRKNYGGKLTWKTWSPNQPKGVSLVSVTNQKGKKLKVTWKKNAAATGYEVQYATSSKFKSVKKVKIKKAATTSTTVSKLTKGKKYYVRIRTYKTVSGKNYYSGWSKAKAAVIKK